MLQYFGDSILPRNFASPLIPFNSIPVIPLWLPSDVRMMFCIYCVALVSAVFILVYADAKYTAEIPKRKIAEYLRKENGLEEDVFMMDDEK